MKVIIIEDEIASLQYLKRVLQDNFPEINIVAVSDNVPDAITLINKYAPDIIFIDIRIKFGTGFDVLAALPEITSEIVFTTAYDQFAIDAFRFHAIDYLLKPIDEKHVVETTRLCKVRIEEKMTGKQIINLLKQLKQPEDQKKKVAIHTLEGIDFIEADDILFAEARGNYTELHLKNKVKITTSKKLKEFEAMLSEPQFLRIHHSYIVNTKCVKKYVKGRGGYVILANDMSLPVSSARKEYFLKLFGG